MSLRIFVTSDNHVGFNELDPIRGNDAANTFDEAMAIARESDVDFIIQGGDLFHVNKPSKQSLYTVMKTLRRTCLGDKPIEFEVLNHGPMALSGAEEYDHPNFEDPNFNVGIPLFAVSGNHDDVGGSGTSTLISPLDVLSMAGLINHIGRIHDSTDITVAPTLIEKNGIRLALYGMASVRDERLYRLFRDKRVKFLRPREEPDTWYNILIVHQNRTPHGATNYLPEQFLPNFMDLIIWGHEHECLIDPQLNDNKGFKVMQPGSTVATSLSASEISPKHVAIVTIAPNKFMTYEKIALKSVRPFAMRTVSLSTDAAHINKNDREARAKVTRWLIDQVNSLIEEANASWLAHHGLSEDSSVDIPLPLIRLRVDYSGGYEVENTTRFSNRFAGQVANTSDILHLIKKKEPKEGRLIPKSSTTGEATSYANDQTNPIEHVGHLMREHLDAEELQVLLERGMRGPMNLFIEKDDKLALKVGVDSLVKDHIEKLLTPMNNLSVGGDSLDLGALNNEQTNPLEGLIASITSSPSKRQKAAAATAATGAAAARAAATRAAAPARNKYTNTERRTGQNSMNSSRQSSVEQSDEIIESDEEIQIQGPSAVSRSPIQPKARAKRSSRLRAAIETSIAPEDVEEANQLVGDDSDEMFSSDEFT